MKKLKLREFLFEQEDELEPDRHRDVDLRKEIINFVDLKDSFEDDKDLARNYQEAISEFGIKERNAVVITSYDTDAAWMDIKNELDRSQIEYYEFDDINGEAVVIFDVNDLEEE